LPRTEQRGGLGRRLVIAIYAIALGYLVIVGFASVIPQVFWPRSDHSFDVECAPGFRLLHDELDQLRLAYLSTNETDAAALSSALQVWDLRFNALAERCDEDQSHLLNQYRHRVELSLRRYMREEAPLAARVNEALGSRSDIQSPMNTEPSP